MLPVWAFCACVMHLLAAERALDPLRDWREVDLACERRFNDREAEERQLAGIMGYRGSECPSILVVAFMKFSASRMGDWRRRRGGGHKQDEPVGGDDADRSHEGERTQVLALTHHDHSVAQPQSTYTSLRSRRLLLHPTPHVMRLCARGACGCARERC